MQPAHLIKAEEFCSHHQLDVSFIRSLAQSGLVEITVIEQTIFIEDDQLEALERYARLHQDLEINLAGIEAIHHLLDRMKQLQQQMQQLRNRLEGE